MPGADSSHWLFRLSADEWLAAADKEVRHCQETLARRAFRPAVTHARRGAGMALNALLVLQPHERWGRSYMEHVTALAEDGTAPDDVREAARLLHDIPPAQPALVQLGRPDMRPAEAARRIVAWCKERLHALKAPPS